MKAYLINPADQSIEITVINSLDDISKMIGFDTLESDAVGTEGDRLYFDEECFLRGSSGRFQIDTLIPVSGKGVIIGMTGDGENLSDVKMKIDELKSRIKYV
jgi:hypothetical protein